MKKKINLIVSLGLALSMTLSSCGSKGGANSAEKALQNFAEAHMDKDIDGMCDALAPKKLWDCVCDDSGLSREKLIYKITGSGEEGFNESADRWSQWLKDEKMKISDLKIEKETEYGDDTYTYYNRAMKNADIDESIDTICYVDTNYSDGFIYEMDGKWYYAPEWLMGDIMTIANEGYDNWNS